MAIGSGCAWPLTELFSPCDRILLSCLSFDEHPFYIRVLVLDLAIYVGNGGFQFLRRDGVGEIHTDIGQNVVRPHMHGQDFIDVFYCVVTLEYGADFCNDPGIGTFADEQSLGFISEPDRCTDQDQADDDRGDAIEEQDASELAESYANKCHQQSQHGGTVFKQYYKGGRILGPVHGFDVSPFALGAAEFT